MTNSSNTAIAKPENLADLVRERIKQAFVEIIPKAQWDELIAAEWADFFADKKNEPHSSPFARMVKSEIAKEAKAQMTASLETALNDFTWGAEYGTDFVKELVKACAPAIVEAFTTQLIRSAAWQMQEAVRAAAAGIQQF